MGEYLSVTELQEMLGVSRATLYRLMARGLPYLKVGSCTRFSSERVLAWLDGDKTILPPGDYRCRGCGWVGHVETPTPLRSLRCPACGASAYVEVGRVR